MKMFRFIEAIERRPQAAFAGFLILHGLVWTALPALLYTNLPLDLIEALTYGREWQIGYDKLPPLPWWTVEAVYRTFGVDTAYYALAQLVVIAAFVTVWKTARPLVGTTGALVAMLVAILIIDGMNYFNYSAAKFNHDVIQLPFWALAGFAFHAALRQGRLHYWLLLGVALGLALWAKYFVVVLAAPLLLFLFIDPEARRRLAGPGPWIAAATVLAVTAPHLVWLIQNNFLPLHYAEARSLPARGPLDHLLHPLEYLGGQALFMLPALLIAAPLVWPAAKIAPRVNADAFDRRIFTVLAFGPALTVLALTLIPGRSTVTMWGYPLWLFLGLWIVLCAPASLDRVRLARIGALWGAMFAIFVAAFVANYLVLPNFDHRHRAAFFPGDLLSAAITQRFEQATGQKPLYSGPWIDLADLRARGAVLVWTEGDPHVLPENFAAVAPGTEISAPFDLPFHRGDGVVHTGWAFLRPQAS